MKININEVFYSIQGEGRSIGAPILFIRLSGCNLKCDFCDTKYHTDIKYKSISEEMLEQMKEYNHWCITGGEPLLQQEKIIELIEECTPEWVEIETNGTIVPHKELIKEVNQWNISPKNPKHNEVKDIKYNFLEWIRNNQEATHLNYIIKFVYTGDDNFIEKIIDEYYLSEDNVYIMPEGATKKEQEQKMKNVIKYCIKNNYNFSPRLHVLVWDSKKGV